MSKPDNVLIIDPAQELKFRGEFGGRKCTLKSRHEKYCVEKKK
jgi:hypothetical protein